MVRGLIHFTMPDYLQYNTFNLHYFVKLCVAKVTKKFRSMCYKRVKVFTTQSHCLSEILSESICNFSYTFFGFYGLVATERESCNKIAVINTDQTTRGVRSNFRPQEGALLKN